MKAFFDPSLPEGQQLLSHEITRDEILEAERTNFRSLRLEWVECSAVDGHADHVTGNSPKFSISKHLFAGFLLYAFLGGIFLGILLSCFALK